MTSPNDRPAKKRKVKKRPLPGVTPAMKNWIDYGVADAEAFANGASKGDK